MSRAVRLWLGLFPILLGLVAVAGGDHGRHRPRVAPDPVAVLYPVIALSFVDQRPRRLDAPPGERNRTPDRRSSVSSGS